MMDIDSLFIGERICVLDLIRLYFEDGFSGLLYDSLENIV